VRSTTAQFPDAKTIVIFRLIGGFRQFNDSIHNQYRLGSGVIVARGWKIATRDCEINIFCDVIFEERNPLALFKRGENVANDFGRDYLISSVDAWESGRGLFYILVARKPAWLKVWRRSHDQIAEAEL
jgi:hypothetical protein